MKRIIVADDDFQQRELYADLFQSAGFEVFPAVDGQEAWDLATVKSVDLIFTGIMMPRMTGFELIDKLRNNKATSPLPVIIFSHLGRDEDRAKAESLSNVVFKVKGYDSPVDILNTAKHLMEKLAARNYPHVNRDAEEDDRPPANLL